MPVPLTTAALLFSAILMAMGADLGSIVVGAAGVLNQVLVELSGPSKPRAIMGEPPEGL